MKTPFTKSITPYFYPRPPGGGRRHFEVALVPVVDFYPRPPGGGRPIGASCIAKAPRFLSTPSGWRATRRQQPPMRARPFLSTPSGWRATAAPKSPLIYAQHFYPRPPGGGRPKTAAQTAATSAISIHALRVEGDLGLRFHAELRVAFLSTPSGWRATFKRVGYFSGSRHFYPRPPGGGRPCHNKMHPEKAKFLSTPSGWRATS